MKSEKEILLKLNHPNICKLYFTFSDEKRLYFIMELVSAGEFIQVLQSHNMMKEEIAKFYFSELVDAIDYLHMKNIVHRDLVSLCEFYTFTFYRNQKISFLVVMDI